MQLQAAIGTLPVAGQKGVPGGGVPWQRNPWRRGPLAQGSLGGGVPGGGVPWRRGPLAEGSLAEGFWTCLFADVIGKPLHNVILYTIKIYVIIYNYIETYRII